MRQRGSNKNNFSRYQTQNQWRSRHHAAAFSTSYREKNWDNETFPDQWDAYYHEDQSHRTINYDDRYNGEDENYYQGQDLPAHRNARGNYEGRIGRHPQASFPASSTWQLGSKRSNFSKKYWTTRGQPTPHWQEERDQQYGEEIEMESNWRNEYADTPRVRGEKKKSVYDSGQGYKSLHHTKQHHLDQSFQYSSAIGHYPSYEEELTEARYDTWSGRKKLKKPRSRQYQDSLLHQGTSSRKHLGSDDYSHDTENQPNFFDDSWHQDIKQRKNWEEEGFYRGGYEKQPFAGSQRTPAKQQSQSGHKSARATNFPHGRTAYSTHDDYNVGRPSKHYVDCYDEREPVCRDLEHRTRLETEVSPCSGECESGEAKSKNRANSGRGSSEIIDDSVTNKKGESVEGFPRLKTNPDQTQLQQNLRMQMQMQLSNQQTPLASKPKTSIAMALSSSQPTQPGSRRHQTNKVYRRKRPYNKGDQPLNESMEGCGLQHAFQPVIDESGFDLSQTPVVREPERPDVEMKTKTEDGATQANPTEALSRDQMRPQAHKATKKNRVACGDDSDSCDFNEIDHIIQDTLLKRSISSEEEQVLRASQRVPQKQEISSEKPMKATEENVDDEIAVVPIAAPTSTDQHQHHVETTSTSDSVHEIHMSPQEQQSSEVVWSVMMPPETVLHCDRLVQSFEQYGKVINVNDIEDSHIEVQYEEKEAAYELQQFLMSRSIEVTVSKTSCAVRCPSVKKKLFQDDDADPELTLKLLKITPKVEELQVTRSDSEFLQDYNSTSMKQQCGASQVIISTEGTDDLSMDNPTLEQAYKMFGSTSDPYSGFPQQARHSLNVPLSTFSEFQSGVFSDRTMDASVSIDGPTDHSGYLMQSSIALDASKNPQQFPNSGNLMCHQSTHQLSANFGSSQSANQFQFENSQFGTQKQPVTAQKFPQSLQVGPNRQTVPKRVQGPFSNGLGHNQDVPFPQVNYQASPAPQLNFYPSVQTQPAQAPQQQQQQNSRQGKNPQFMVNLERILNCEDNRTTIMIRHIPNKYTEEMLLERINRLHEGTYDYFYLPLDLNNMCNIGYAFINFIDPIFIVPFYEDLNNQSWETFNSEKICEIAYGSIQGKRNLVEKVNNNSRHETRKVKPLIFDVGYYDATNIEDYRQQLIAERRQSDPCQLFDQQVRGGQSSASRQNPFDHRAFH